MSSQRSSPHFDTWCCRTVTLPRFRFSIVRFPIDHLIERSEQFSEKMGPVNTRAVVEHCLAVRRRDGQSRAEGEQDTEPHLKRTRRPRLIYLGQVNASSSAIDVSPNSTRLSSMCTRSRMCPPDSLRARLNANAAAEKGCGVRRGCFPPLQLPSPRSALMRGHGRFNA